MTDMHTIVGALKLAGIWVGGMGAGILADNLPVLTPDTHVPLGTAVGVGVACLGAAFWLSRQLTQLKDGQKFLQTSQNRLEAGQSALSEAFKKLPCHDWQPTKEECAKPPIIKP